jgi:ring-1,2-phenylacetyl-CoA epoxidase subunit PaaD
VVNTRPASVDPGPRASAHPQTQKEEARKEEARKDEARKGEARKGEAREDEAREDEVRIEETREEEGRKEETREEERREEERREGKAREGAAVIAGRVTDPELPLLTLADLGILRDVREAAGRVEVAITPTYSGCPALATIRDDLVRALREAGYRDVRVRTVLSPAWTTDWITPAGRNKLVAAGISPPGPRQAVSAHRPIPITLTARPVPCPRCGNPDSEELSAFGATACRSLRRCRSCGEPFEHVKEL